MKEQANTILQALLNQKSSTFDALALIARYHQKRFEAVIFKNREQAEAHLSKAKGIFNQCEKLASDCVRIRSLLP